MSVLCELILKPTLCIVTKLVRSVILCSAKSSLECSEGLKGSNLQAAIIAVNYHGFQQELCQIPALAAGSEGQKSQLWSNGMVKKSYKNSLTSPNAFKKS